MNKPKHTPGPFRIVGEMNARRFGAAVRTGWLILASNNSVIKKCKTKREALVALKEIAKARGES